MASVAPYQLTEFIVVVVSLYVFTAVSTTMWSIKMSVLERGAWWHQWFPLVALLCPFGLLLLPIRIGTILFVDGVLFAYIGSTALSLLKMVRSNG